MAVVFNWRTSATLAGGMTISRMNRQAAQEELGFKVERSISAINELQTTVSLLNVAVSNIHTALLSGMTTTGIGISGVFSALSGAGSFTSTGTTLTRTVALAVTAVSNFRASNPA